MVEDILPENFKVYFNNLNFNYINEIRLRANKPIVVNVMGRNKFLTTSGLTENIDEAIICKLSDISEIIKRASDNSLYAVNDQIKKGFLTIKGGIRIGVCGEVVEENDCVNTIKNINSLNIRIPHKIKNCSLNAYLHIVNNNKVRNTLIISPPGAGKTTFIRDLAEQISIKNPAINILLVDERAEISATVDGMQMLNVGPSCDIYTNCSKAFAFENGIRSMKPDVIITDEINLDDDLKAIKTAITSGVSVIATIHANDIYDLKSKPNFDEILKNKIFERYVVLSSKNGPGTYEGIFNENLVCVYLWWLNLCVYWLYLLG